MLDAAVAGVTLSTHLGNLCARMLPRDPNLLWEWDPAPFALRVLRVDD
jgi:hypothetical protein